MVLGKMLEERLCDFVEEQSVVEYCSPAANWREVVISLELGARALFF